MGHGGRQKKCSQYTQGLPLLTLHSFLVHSTLIQTNESKSKGFKTATIALNRYLKRYHATVQNKKQNKTKNKKISLILNTAVRKIIFIFCRDQKDSHERPMILSNGESIGYRFYKIYSLQFDLSFNALIKISIRSKLGRSVFSFKVLILKLDQD